MTKPQVSVDADVFSRTAALFAVKRTALARDSVEMLARNVVHRLAQGNKRPQTFDNPQISQDSIDAFCEVLIQPDPGAALRFIQDRRAEGVSRQAVYLGYVTAAARCLGDGWEEDRLSFLQVTIGSGHLYALMRAMRTEGPTLRPAFDARRYALFATVPGEDHGIGITVAADLFREVGWEIDLQIGTDHDTLVAHVERSQPRIIGLSLSTGQRLDALVRLVVDMRITLPEAIIGVAPALNMDAGQLREVVDVDLVFGDATSARIELERLMRS
jgi:methanogenic corrinoid protein MtbC1